MHFLFPRLLLTGCPAAKTPPAAPETSKTVSPTASSTPLRIIVVDDVPLAESIERQWLAADGGPLAITNVTSEKVCNRDEVLPTADLFIYPAALLGELAERDLIAPIPKGTLDSPAYNRRDIFGLVAQREGNWGEKTMALPLGSPQLMLLYRADIFERLEVGAPHHLAGISTSGGNARQNRSCPRAARNVRRFYFEFLGTVGNGLGRPIAFGTGGVGGAAQEPVLDAVQLQFDGAA